MKNCRECRRTSDMFLASFFFLSVASAVSLYCGVPALGTIAVFAFFVIHFVYAMTCNWAAFDNKRENGQ